MTTNVIELKAHRPKPPVDGAKAWIVDGKHCGWIMPEVKTAPIYRKYK